MQRKEILPGFALEQGMHMFFIELIFIGLFGTIAFIGLWPVFVFGHIGGLGILGLLGNWSGHVAQQKGYGYRRAFWACFAPAVILGVVSVVIVHGSGGRGCGGIVSIAVALAVIAFYALAKRKRAEAHDRAC